MFYFQWVKAAYRVLNLPTVLSWMYLNLNNLSWQCYKVLAFATWRLCNTKFFFSCLLVLFLSHQFNLSLRMQNCHSSLRHARLWKCHELIQIFLEVLFLNFLCDNDYGGDEVFFCEVVDGWNYVKHYLSPGLMSEVFTTADLRCIMSKSWS